MLGADRAAAHTTPQVWAIVDQDANGPSALRLNEGLAIKTGTQWHFACPARYGGDVQDPAEGLPWGGVALGAASGIWVLDRTGGMAPYPDPAAAGVKVVAFARGETRLFALRSQGDLHDVVEVGAERLSVVWSDARPWNDMAAGSGFLQLVRFELDEIEELRLSLAGEVIAQARAALPDARAAYARATGSEAYIVATSAGSEYELGRIERGLWHVLQRAGGNLAGPVQSAQGQRFVALDGKLATFDADAISELSDTGFVVGLRRFADRSYASTTTGLRELSSGGLGASLFELGQLLPPDLNAVAVERRSACNLEWQHYRFELMAANISLAATTAPSVTNQAGLGAAGSGGVAASGAGWGAGVGGTAAGVAFTSGTPKSAGTGCAVTSGRHPSALSAALLALVASSWIARRARAGRERLRCADR